MRINGTGAWRWRAAGVAVTSCALLTGTVLPGSPASAQTAPDPCPEPFPVDELEVGMEATGLTVERGTTPDPFNASILGVLDDGIAPGVDMIIAETSSPAIERAGGIWAGMSGSPVYAPDGRLIGAVAYGFSTAPSPIAGITPAADMYQVLARPSTVGVEGEELVRLPAALRSRVVGTGEVTATEAAAGMSQLPMPFAVSGLSAERFAQVTERLGDHLPANTRLVSTAPATGTGSPADIIPGGNFATTESFGDLTSGGVGTTTVVCDDRALAFGHPAFFYGATTLGAHPADAVFVQRDNTLGSFKVANILGVVGTVDQDRLAGIRAQLGALPATVPVSSMVTSTEGGARDGLTQVSFPRFLPDIAVFHLVANEDRVFEQIGPGTSRLRWVVDGQRASGAPFQLDYTNHYASSLDISFESIFDAFDQLLAIQENPFEDVTITGVRFEEQMDPTFTYYSITQVSSRQPDGSYQPVPTDEPLQVVNGSRLQLRVTLTPYQNQGPAVNVDLSVLVPHGTAGAFGTLDVFGGRGFDEEAEPESFDQLLTQLDRTAPNNAVSANLSLFEGEEPTQTQGRALADQVVQGEQSFEVEVVSALRAKPAVIDGGTWQLRGSLSSGNPSRTFSFGDSSYQQLTCDFNGDGRTEPVLFREGTWLYRTSMTGTTTQTFNFGQAGDRPLCGDWNGDGREEVGVFRSGRWLLRTGVASGSIGWDFTFGPASGWKPVIGDWNGDAIDTIGLVRRGEWQVRNRLSSGDPSYTFTFGEPGDVALVGDWNRDGRDTIGVYRDGIWRIRNALLSGSASVFEYGGAASRPVVWR
jgi:hypothetical protein